MRRVALAAVLLIGACAGSSRPPAPVFIPDAQGLGVAGTDLRIDFDRSPEGVIAVLDRSLGEHRALSLDGCPAQVTRRLRWGVLELTFGPERFIGWRDGQGQAGVTCAVQATGKRA